MAVAQETKTPSPRLAFAAPGHALGLEPSGFAGSGSGSSTGLGGVAQLALGPQLISPQIAVTVDADGEFTADPAEVKGHTTWNVVFEGFFAADPDLTRDIYHGALPYPIHATDKWQPDMFLSKLASIEREASFLTLHEPEQAPDRLNNGHVPRDAQFKGHANSAQSTSGAITVYFDLNYTDEKGTHSPVVWTRSLSYYIRRYNVRPDSDAFLHYVLEYKRPETEEAPGEVTIQQTAFADDARLPLIFPKEVVWLHDHKIDAVVRPLYNNPYWQLYTPTVAVASRDWTQGQLEAYYQTLSKGVENILSELEFTYAECALKNNALVNSLSESTDRINEAGADPRRIERVIRRLQTDLTKAQQTYPAADARIVQTQAQIAAAEESKEQLEELLQQHQFLEVERNRVLQEQSELANQGGYVEEAEHRTRDELNEELAEAEESLKNERQRLGEPEPEGKSESESESEGEGEESGSGSESEGEGEGEGEVKEPERKRARIDTGPASGTASRPALQPEARNASLFPGAPPPAPVAPVSARAPAGPTAMQVGWYYYY